MRDTHFTKHLTSFFIILWVSGVFICTNLCVADDLSIFNGRVVNEKGESVDGVTIALLPVTFRKGAVVPLRFTPGLNYPSFQQKPINPDVDERIDLNEIQKRLVIPQSMSDSDGQFTISGINAGMYQFTAAKQKLLSQISVRNESDVEIGTIRIGNATVYPQLSTYSSDNAVIGFKPSVNIENVEITVRFRMKIQGKIVFKEGSPLTNKKVRLSLYSCQMDGTRHRPSSGSLSTDEKGNFMHYINEPGIYSISAMYLGHTTGSEFLVVPVSGPPEDLVLSFDDITLDQIRPNLDTLERPRLSILEALDVWVVNPENNHSYKKITCTSWRDAQTKAVTEDAHLVSINNDDEQIWLEAVFSHGPYWIGLTDIEKEGTWQWDTGEPVTFTNWSKDDIFPNDLEDDEKNYAIISFSEGGWMAIGRGHPAWFATQTAIIEKDGLKSKTPSFDR